MRNRGWGPCHCLGGHQLIGTKSWDLRRRGRVRDRQTEKWTQGVCQKDKNSAREEPSERSQKHRSGSHRGRKSRDTDEVSGQQEEKNGREVWKGHGRQDGGGGEGLRQEARRGKDSMNRCQREIKAVRNQ